MKNLIQQIKALPGVKEIYPAGAQSVVVVFHPDVQTIKSTDQCTQFQTASEKK